MGFWTSKTTKTLEKSGQSCAFREEADLSGPRGKKEKIYTTAQRQRGRCVGREPAGTDG